MSGVAIMRALLAAHPALLDLVPANNIRAGTLPQGFPMPAISVRSVGDTEEATVARNMPVKMIRERVQVTVYAKGALETAYPQMRKILKATALGPGVHTGVVQGIKVNSILPQGTNPEIPPADDGIFEQSRDFMVTFLEAN